MRRSIQIAISLAAVVLLLKPFDCFSSGPITKKTAECCKRGKCMPSSNSDDCCKGTIPGGKQLLGKAADHVAIDVVFLVANVTAHVPLVFGNVISSDVLSLSASPPDTRLNLPLLI